MFACSTLTRVVTRVVPWVVVWVIAAFYKEKAFFSKTQQLPGQLPRTPCPGKCASAGNRARVTSMATMYSATRPLMPRDFLPPPAPIYTTDALQFHCGSNTTSLRNHHKCIINASWIHWTDSYVSQLATIRKTFPAETHILNLAPCILQPTAYSLHLTSYILHLTSCILHLASCILHSTSYTLHLASYSLHLASYILHLTSCILHLASYLLHLASCILHFTSYILHLASCILELTHFRPRRLRLSSMVLQSPALRFAKRPGWQWDSAASQTPPAAAQVALVDALGPLVKRVCCACRESNPGHKHGGLV